MNTRVTEVRKYYGLTMEKFGERLGVGKSAISGIESGRSNPSDQLLRSICREFQINETWLRTGDGEMLAELSQDEKLSRLFAQVFVSDKDEEFKKMAISALLEMPEEFWGYAEQYANKLYEQMKEREDRD